MKPEVKRVLAALDAARMPAAADVRGGKVVVTCPLKALPPERTRWLKAYAGVLAEQGFAVTIRGDLVEVVT